MTAGSPNWQKLYEMGKLPKDARGNVAGLAQLDAAEKRIKELEEEIAKLKEGSPLTTVTTGEFSNYPGFSNTEGSPIKVKCEVEGCDYTGEGRTEGIARNVLRMHGKTHKVKEEE